MDRGSGDALTAGFGSSDAGDPARYRPETGCAASAERRGDLLLASAPPAERWLLIETNRPWPRVALEALQYSSALADDQPVTAQGVPTDGGRPRVRAAGLGAEVARLCAELRCRPVLIRRHGRTDRDLPRRWALIDSRPGSESIRWGELPTDEHVLKVLAGTDPGTPSTEPIYLVCTHGRHDACCAVRGRPVASALAAAYPERTWESSHVGGDRFAPNVVLLPHSLYYGHVTPPGAVAIANAYDKGEVVPKSFRGSGALPPHVQAAQHFARAAGHPTTLDSLRPSAVVPLAGSRWSIKLTTDMTELEVEVESHQITIDGQMTCAAQPPGVVRQFTLNSPVPTPKN
ncbi:sucrase/ferredoxin-like protein [Kribbella amoyensis]|uniref:Sucrase/ferredoxin-like protein n=1 Tax=Kribbella amoyensis TaxID=996641 RepID=A0A561BPJ6_9ACTN|nr:sucrase ferredoxin [Kribbella amoyensis]TWD80799.1 sucrase/ferredoxin-like protein [Kribbella amoyensis]